MKEYCDEYGIETDHITATRHFCEPIEDKKIFVKDGTVSQATLRKHYLEGNYSEYKCAICGMPPYWQDKELVLILDHIDGDHHNDELSNLRWVCPNCNQQLPTTGYRSWRRKSKVKKWHCDECGKEISYGQHLCHECAAKKQWTDSRKNLTRDELKKEIRNNSFAELGKKYNVYGSTIRKWCKAMDLPNIRKQIESYSDEEWAKI